MSRYSYVSVYNNITNYNKILYKMIFSLIVNHFYYLINIRTRSRYFLDILGINKSFHHYLFHMIKISKVSNVYWIHLKTKSSFYLI